MTATNFLETNILKLLFNALPITGLATNATSSPVGTLYLSLHTSDPGEGGTQATNEILYTGYARAAITRDSNGWVVSNNTVTNSGVVDFPTSLGGFDSATYFGLGIASTGAGVLLFTGPLGGTIDISPNTTPSFNSGNLIITAE